MLSTDRNLIIRTPHGFPIAPLLLMVNQSSLAEDVVEENVHHHIMACVDLTAYLSAATDDVLRRQLSPGLAAETCRLRLFLRYQLLPLPHAEEALLNLPNYLHRLGGAVQGPA